MRQKEIELHKISNRISKELEEAREKHLEEKKQKSNQLLIQ